MKGEYSEHIKSLKEENINLRNENTELKRQVTELIGKNDYLQKDVSNLNRKFDEFLNMMKLSSCSNLQIENKEEEKGTGRNRSEFIEETKASQNGVYTNEADPKESDEFM
jgi:FtsZ-binding cell division protein ZapB